MVTSEKKKAYQREYRQRIKEEFKDAFRLSLAEKIRIGLVKAPARKGNVRIAFPVHYTSSSCEWKTEWVTDVMLPRYKCEHPNLQVLEVRRVK